MNQIDGTAVAGAVSDRWLRIFLVAAETGSFTAAGERLGIGQPAVSHAVKRLETALGTRVFERTTAGIRLTELGEDLRQRVATGFDLVDAAVLDAQGRARADQVVTLSVSTALATHWLMPRLASFKELHPVVELRVMTQDTDDGVGRDGADLWIPLGGGPWPAMRVWRFADERLAPVASPSYVERVGADASLADVDLLHTEERYQARFDWERWFALQGLDVTHASRGQRSNDYSIVVHAALEGQGVALGWLHIVAPLIDDGRLAQLGDDTVTTESPFCIVARRDATRRPGVDALRHWLLSEAADLRSDL